MVAKYLITLIFFLTIANTNLHSQTVETKVAEPSSSTSLEKQRIVFDPFQRVTGVTEAEFKKNQNKFFQGGKIKNITTGQAFSCGDFKVSTIEKLAQETGASTNPSRFSVIESFDLPDKQWCRPFFDVGALQADPNNQRVVFQVASNFDGLEGGGDPNQGIKPYESAGYYVQGEAAALSALPGTIFRMYYFEHPASKMAGSFGAEVMYAGQLTNQINFLDNFSDITIRNGYVTTVNNPKKFNNFSQQQKTDFVNQVKIGFHTNIQVTSGLGPTKKELTDGVGFKAIPIDDPQQKIHQVFTATLNLHSFSNKNDYEGLARLLLEAAYKGTLYSTCQTSRQKVILTLVGGGVFGNKLSWIVDAIDKAVAEIGDLDITLIVYYSQGYDKAEWNYAESVLLNRVATTGGTYNRYKQDGVYSVELAKTPKAPTMPPKKGEGLVKRALNSLGQALDNLYNSII